MNYSDFDANQKHHIAGVLGVFMDRFIRKNRTWTPEQMYAALMEDLEQKHANGMFGSYVYADDGSVTQPYILSEVWLVSADAKEFLLERMSKKHEKNKKLALKKSPLVERIRFGLRWDTSKFYDINFGLKNGSDYVKTEIVEYTNLIPWSIEHVAQELYDKYRTTLSACLSQLSDSPIETVFWQYWLSHYGNRNDVPALIPEVCGDRKLYYYPQEQDGSSMRFDFAVVNFKKQRRALIELDGHETHKSKEDRGRDASKRNVAAERGWQMYVFTGTQVYNDIEGCFAQLDDILTL